MKRLLIMLLGIIVYMQMPVSFLLAADSFTSETAIIVQGGFIPPSGSGTVKVPVGGSGLPRPRK